MSYPVKLLIVAVLALVLHVVLGWAWTIAAGVAAGFWIGRGGWHLGAASVGVEWLLVLIYNYFVASRAVHLMSENLGSLLGNLPFFVVVAFTPMIGALLGLLGGAAGTQLARMLRQDQSDHAATLEPGHKYRAGA